ncbi:MAG: caspase family protein [Thermoleophilia bacterium]
MFFYPRKIAIVLFITILALNISLFGAVSTKASDTLPRPVLGPVSGISPLPAAATPGTPSQTNKKFAVVIGIDYASMDLGAVNFADRDAQSVYNLLTDRMGFPRENVMLLQNQNATRDNIDRALDWLAGNPAIDAGSDVVFFYSGHGLRNGDGVGLNNPAIAPGYALVPFDFAGFDYKNGDGLVWDSYLAQQLGRISPARMWITIDSCNAGGFNRPGITGPNRVVTLSSQSDELSSEIPEAGRGVFTQYFIEEGVARGIPVEQAYQAAAPRAAAAYGQNPQMTDEYAGNMDFFHPS